MQSGMLHGLKIARGAPPISHLLFADDCFLFLRATSAESVQMKYVLDTYSAASGQKLNFDNSMVCFGTNVHQQQRNEVINILGVSQGDTAQKYLGLPSLVGRNKKPILGFLKDKILNRVRSWNSKFLSRAGREVLIKNVLQAMPCYAMMVFLLPIGMFDRRWQRFTMAFMVRIEFAKGEGWIRVSRLREMNLALLGKQAWRLVTRPDSLVAQVYKSRYFPRGSFFDATAGSNPSFIWRSILEVQNVVQMGCRRCIGDGLTTYIGSYPWLPTTAEPYVSTILHDSVRGATISSLLNTHGTGWDVDCLKDIFNDRDANIIFKISVSLCKPPNAWVWYWEPKGNYSVKSCYRLLMGEFQNTLN
ncbi:uncharacterized protein LOC116010837 [Ipomoea triloba]|uniref:uncharacterized protein LOC116010837 n=1 Tax=Ipomoea triloba TaxID=35885 RepID=UPI00125CF1C0|nr:uncharacterized protein LOC116010837 [Ipomoea triloba]